jgi:hypothetical protein
MIPIPKNTTMIPTPKNTTMIPIPKNTTMIPTPQNRAIIPKLESIMATKSETGLIEKSRINNDFINPLPIHKEYGVIDIPGIKIIDIKPSSHIDKKYAITVEYNGVTKIIHYGNSNYQHYEDRTPIKTYSYLDHHDEKRRRSYLARASKIRKGFNFAANDPFSANRYAIITLW